MALAHIVKQAVWVGEKERWHLRVDREPMAPIGQRLGEFRMSSLDQLP
jgi:hypothetical protein